MCLENVKVYLIEYFTIADNLSLNKPAWMKSTYLNFGAACIVDGNSSDTSVRGGMCALSWAGETGEWRVDLGGVLSIHHAYILYRTENQAWGMYMFIKSLVFGGF